jgi:predicted nucleic acid-binding protein
MTHSRILLDTNAYSDWRRKNRWNNAISRAGTVMIPAIVLGELRAGFKDSAREEENERKLVQFISDPVVRVLDVVESSSRNYAALKHFLKKSGTPIPENDIWIAALAVEHLVPVVTSDAHFNYLPQVARIVDSGEEGLWPGRS